MKGWFALARALGSNAPLCRQQLVLAVAKQLAAGNAKAAEVLGRYLDRYAYGEACVHATELRRKHVEQAIAHCIARCFVALRDGAFRLRRSRQEPQMIRKDGIQEAGTGASGAVKAKASKSRRDKEATP